MNSGLDGLVKNLTDNDFMYLSQEFCDVFLKLVKQKGVCSYEYMDSCKIFFEDKLPDRSRFFSSLKSNILGKQIIYMLIMFGIYLK